MNRYTTAALILLSGLLAGRVPAQPDINQQAQNTYERAMKVYAVDAQASVDLLKQAAKKGHVEAMVRLGYIFQTGPNAKPKEALSWYKKAAEAGHTAAIFEIGSIHEQGSKRMQPDRAEAITWYQKGVSNNSVKCAEALAGLYASGEDPAFHDGETALYLATALCRKNPEDPAGLDLLAAACARNLDFPGALRAASQAVALSNLEEAPRRRALREQYEQGIPHPPVASDAWLLEAAERENTWAVLQLADRYSDELSEQFDPVTARHWYEVAAQNGNPDALLQLGFMAFYGEGGTLDMGKACWCFSRAAEAGNAEAFAPLARMYLGGKGTRQDLEKALEWYQRAADETDRSYNTQVQAVKKLLRNPDTPEHLYQQALREIADDAPTRSGKPKTYAMKTFEVASLFWLAAEQDHPQAMKEIADMYFYGKRYFVREAETDHTTGGLNSNYTKAWGYYRQLAGHGITAPEMETCRELYLTALENRRKRASK